MSLPRDSFQSNVQEDVVNAWREFLDNMEKGLDSLEKGIEDARETASVCTSEWCEATEHVIDELSNSLFSISEPKFSTDEDSKRLKMLKRRVHDLYADYRSVQKTSA